MHRDESAGKRLRRHLDESGITAFIGAYDVFSAAIAAQKFNGIFLSGFGLSASFYGLPDEGFVAWPDMVSFAERTRRVLASNHIIADVDDGYGDAGVAANVARAIETAGASGIIMEDQKRPRKCGHLDGKTLISMGEYTDKLKAVLAARRDLFVIARTDASGEGEILDRVKAYSSAGADAVLVDALASKELIRKVTLAAGCKVAYNQITGGKSPSLKLKELEKLGVAIVIYSTPCLFAAQGAVQKALSEMKLNGGLLPEAGQKTIDLKACNAILNENLSHEDKRRD
jgi:2-methylisocitrate lyase-like PEP mutase family enzyme